MASMMVLNQKFWSQQRVFLTGHTGFIGGWLAKALGLLGARVHGYALPANTKPAMHTSMNFGPDFTEALADIRNIDDLGMELIEFAPTLVVHLAAEALVRRGHRHPVATYASNVMGSVNLLEALRALPDKVPLITFTTDKVYTNSESGQAFREQDNLGSEGIYDSSKACTEILIKAYQSSFYPDRGVATVRAGNVIGGGDWNEDRLIPDVVRAHERGEALTLRLPDAVRPWQHVLEPVYATLLLAESLDADAKRFSGPWNIGPEIEDHIAVGELVQHFNRYWQGHPGAFKVASSDIHEAHLLYLDTQKAKTQLGWQPRIQLEEAVAMTAQWYRDFLQGADINALTEQQILKVLALS